ncbi:MAG: SusC/RagA family TonB-linked outer membrane protein [Bacteroidales bacterium]
MKNNAIKRVAGSNVSDSFKQFLLVMKLTTILLVITLVQVSAKGLSQSISIKGTNIPIKEVLKSIENQSLYTFFYDIKDLPNVNISVDLSEAPINEVLNTVFKGIPEVTYKIVKSNVVITKVEIQKTITVTGVVTDKDGVTLPGASVIIKGKSVGTTTNNEGKYSIEAEINDTLVFAFLGYVLQEISVNERSLIDVVLQSDLKSIEEVVVVGYGVAKKKDLTGTVSTVKATEIQQVKSQTIDESLAGRMTGVFVTASGGAPGSGSIVHVRGLSSLKGDNQPLYVVDGVPIVQNPNFGTLGLGTYGDRANPLLSINPNDIERIDVLKDASAAAIYGSRAANGVIIVTTKRGKKEQMPRFNLSISSTIQNPIKEYDLLSASEWIALCKDQAQKTLDQYPEIYWSYFPTQYAIVNDPSYFGTANTDWQDLIRNKNALWNTYNFNVSGGSNAVNYMLSVTASNQDGIMKGNELDRYSFASNLDANVTSKFKVGGSINYSYSSNKSSGISSLQNGFERPDIAPYDENGNYTTYEGTYGTQYNVLKDQGDVKNKTVAKNIYGSVYGELNLLKNLKVKSQVNINLNDSKVLNFTPSYSSTALFYGMYYSEPGARLYNQINEGYAIAFENTVNYNNTFNKLHSIDALFGVSWDQSRLDLQSQEYRGFPDDEYLTNIGSAQYADDYSSESIENGLNSFFGRVNYIYNDKYLVTFTGRYDGSTKFGPNNQWGFFPSGALAWNLHNEDFLKDYSFINSLKLRASLGRTGSDNLPAFSYLAYYQSLDNGDSYYNGVNGIAVAGVPNKSIKWETTDQLDLGMEFSLFNSRLNGEIVYFRKKTSGIILSVPIPAETGFSSWSDNVADVSNKGFEIMLAGDIIRTTDFRWNSSFNISFVKNNVDAMHGGNTSSSGTSTGIVEGYPIGVVVGYDVVKIAQTQEEINTLNEKAGGTYQSSLTAPGDYIFRDANGDGVITSADKKPLGDINPNYYGGWNNTFSYKNIDFSMNWVFVQGPQKQYTAITNLYYFSVAQNALSLVKDTWTETNTDAKYARLGSGTHGSVPTSKSVVDASYIRLRSAAITYNFPKKWLSSTPISNARLTFSGNNLLTFTKYPGLDPESVNSQRGGATIDMISDGGAAYPQVRSFTFSLNVTF